MSKFITCRKLAIVQYSQNSLKLSIKYLDFLRSRQPIGRDRGPKVKHGPTDGGRTNKVHPEQLRHHLLPREAAKVPGQRPPSGTSTTTTTTTAVAAPHATKAEDQQQQQSQCRSTLQGRRPVQRAEQAAEQKPESGRPGKPWPVLSSSQSTKARLGVRATSATTRPGLEPTTTTRPGLEAASAAVEAAPPSPAAAAARRATPENVPPEKSAGHP